MQLRNENTDLTVEDDRTFTYWTGLRAQEGQHNDRTQMNRAQRSDADTITQHVSTTDDLR